MLLQLSNTGHAKIKGRTCEPTTELSLCPLEDSKRNRTKSNKPSRDHFPFKHGNTEESIQVSKCKENLKGEKYS